MSDIIFVRQIAEEIARIVETLRLTLNLKAVIIGEMNFQPSPGVTKLVNGVWIIPTPVTTIDPDALPKVVLERYFYRLVYVRRMAPGENVVKKAMEDAAVLVNALTDHWHVPDITTLPQSAQILWMGTRSIEWEPGEDNAVQALGADITAIAFNLEVQVRARRA